jgi:hypothetical protein
MGNKINTAERCAPANFYIELVEKVGEQYLA